MINSKKNAQRFRWYLQVTVYCLLSTVYFLTCSSPSEGPLTVQILQISKESEIRLFGRNPDLRVYEKRLDEMAADLSQTIGPNDSPEAIITKLNLYIFTRLQMIPQPDNNGMEFTCLTGILDNKKSSCLGLTGLYLVLAEKLDLPLYGVLLPGHSFVRYQNGPTERNIETLRNGIERSDQFYKEYFNVQNPGDTYLRNLNNDELLALYNFNLGNACRERGLFEDAERKYRQATRLFPEFKEARDNLQNLSTKVQRDKGT